MSLSSVIELASAVLDLYVGSTRTYGGWRWCHRPTRDVGLPHSSQNLTMIPEHAGVDARLDETAWRS